MEIMDKGLSVKMCGQKFPLLRNLLLAMGSRTRNFEN